MPILSPNIKIHQNISNSSRLTREKVWIANYSLKKCSFSSLRKIEKTANLTKYGKSMILGTILIV